MYQDISRDSPHIPRVSLVTGGLKLGGATTFLCNLGGELIRRSIPVNVLSLEHENPLELDFIAQCIPVITQNEHALIYEDRMAATLKEIAKFQPNVLVANLSAMSFEILRYAPPGVMRVGVAHSDEDGVYQMVRRYGTYLDVMIAVSQTIKAKLEAMDEFRDVSVVHAPLGVPMPKERRAAKNQRIFPLQIIYVGRIEQEQKRAHLFPEIFAGLKASGIPFQLTIAGDGSLLPWLKKNIGNSNPTQTASFTGKVAYQAMPALLEQHDIFLLASDFEGLPLSLLEAMGYGLVPVVSDLPSGISEVVDENCGWLVKLDNVEGFTRGIVWLHEHREALERMSRIAHEKVQRYYSIEAMADRWLAIFAQAAVKSSVWPLKCMISSPLGSENGFAFSPLGILLRRWRMRLRRTLIFHH